MRNNSIQNIYWHFGDARSAEIEAACRDGRATDWSSLFCFVFLRFVRIGTWKRKHMGWITSRFTSSDWWWAVIKKSMSFALHSESICAHLMQTKCLFKVCFDFQHQSLIQLVQLCNISHHYYIRPNLSFVKQKSKNDECYDFGSNHQTTLY